MTMRKLFFWLKLLVAVLAIIGIGWEVWLSIQWWMESRKAERDDHDTVGGESRVGFKKPTTEKT